MHLRTFVREAAGCTVGRPELIRPILTTAGGALAGVALGVLATMAHMAMAALCVGLGALSLVAAARGWPSLVTSIRLRARGAASYAISTDQLLLVDPIGNAVRIDLDRIVALELEDGEPRLRIDSELQGRVYATMFSIFEDGAGGPSAERFYERLATTLRARSSSAQLIEHEASEHGLVG